MDKLFGKDLPPLQREAMLKDNCDAIVETSYMKRFTPEEILEKKERLSSVDIDLNDVEEEKRDAIADFKAQMKPLKEERKELLKNIKQKSELITEKCYKMVDHRAKDVGYYNSKGQLVFSRPARPEEAQGNIFKIKTGIND